MTTVCIEMPLVLFEFSSDDAGFRSKLFAAIDANECPDFTRSLGGDGPGRHYAAVWRLERADAVRAWARSIGVEVTSDPGHG